MWITLLIKLKINGVYRNINEGTTDHFIVIVGRKNIDSNLYYIYYEVGTHNKEKGESDDNKLLLGDDYSLRREMKNKKYIVTQVRRNKKK